MINGVTKSAKKARQVGADGKWFGERLRALREARGMSHAKLASESGVSVQAIFAYEAEPSREPQFFNGVAMAEALGVTPSELAGRPITYGLAPGVAIGGGFRPPVSDAGREESPLATEVRALRLEQAEAADRLTELAEVVEAMKASLKQPATARSKKAM